MSDTYLIKAEVHYLASRRRYEGTVRQTEHFIEGCREIERRWGITREINNYWRNLASELMVRRIMPASPITDGWYQEEDDAIKLLKDGATWARRSSVNLRYGEICKLESACERLGWPLRTPAEYTERARVLLWDEQSPPSTPPSPPYAPSSPAYTPAQQPVDISDSESDSDDELLTTRSVTPAVTPAVSSENTRTATPQDRKRTIGDMLKDTLDAESVDKIVADVQDLAKKRKLELEELSRERPTCTVCQDPVDENDQAIVPPCGDRAQCVFHVLCFSQLCCRPLPNPYKENAQKCPNCGSLWDKPAGVHSAKGPSVLDARRLNSSTV